ncbi:hypothetical protein GF312_22185 [Candidatus Poribacteria bacterium]|nr:hypothetical protein [Candidatus Poribacteria bacterium]
MIKDKSAKMFFLLYLVMIVTSFKSAKCESIFFVSDKDGCNAIYYMEDKVNVIKIFTLPKEFECKRIISLKLSPDGRYIAFSLDGGELFIIASNGTNHMALGRGHSPSWSPSGSQIVFVDNGNIYIMDIRTLAIKKLADNGLSPDWSPDGKFIAFIRDKKNIILLKPDGSDQQTIFEAELTLVKQLARISWSPDSENLALITDGRRRICVVRSDGKDLRFLYPDPDGQILVMTVGVDYPCWSNDGSKIMFMKTKSENQNDWDIWIMNHDGTEQQKVVCSSAYEGNPVFDNIRYNVQLIKSKKIEKWSMIKRKCLDHEL